MMRLGISSYTYSWAVGVPGKESSKRLTCHDLLQKAIDHRVDCVQFADNLPVHELTGEERHLLLQNAEKNDIGIELGIGGLLSDTIEKYLDLAEYFRSPILRVVIDKDNFKPDIQTVIGIIRNYLSDFASRNIKLAIENHDRLKAAEFARIIESVGDDHVGICLDAVNSMGAGEGFEEVFRILGPYTINFHIKDFCVKRVDHLMGFIVEGTPTGKGMLSLPYFINKLKGWDRCESVILELWTPPLESIEQTIERENKWADESLEFLRTLI